MSNKLCSYRFIVAKDGDYKENIEDPDKAVPWEQIEQVSYITENDSEYNCPICLEPPVAAKISKCGHVFCWACIIRHLSYTKGSGKYSKTKTIFAYSQHTIGQCPLCFYWILLKDMKSTVIEKVPKISVSDHVAFSLLQRAGDLSVPMLKEPNISGQAQAKVQRLPNSSEQGSEYCILSIADDVSDILAREWEELDTAAQLAASSQDDSLPFIVHAQDSLRERAEKAHVSMQTLTNTHYKKKNKHRKKGANSSTTTTTSYPTTDTTYPTLTSTPYDSANLNNTPTTSTQSIDSVNENHEEDKHTNDTNVDHWESDENDDDTSDTTTAATTATPTTTSTLNNFTVTLHSSLIDSVQIPPSILSNSTQPQPQQQPHSTETEATATPSHPAPNENLTQETSYGLYYFYQGIFLRYAKHCVVANRYK